MIDSRMPKITSLAMSQLGVLCDNSCPPLKPMANSRYSDKNLLVLSGITRSLFTTAAIIPSRKKRRTGLVRLATSVCNSICGRKRSSSS